MRLRAICWPKSLIISTSLSGRVGAWGGSGVRREEIKGGSTPNEFLVAMRCREEGEREVGLFVVQRTGEQIHCRTIQSTAYEYLFIL